MTGDKFDYGCPYCGGTVGHTDECPHSDYAESYGKCAICGKPLDADDRVFTFDGTNQKVHESCAVFKKEGLTWFLDVLGIEYYADRAKDVLEV